MTMRSSWILWTLAVLLAATAPRVQAQPSSARDNEPTSQNLKKARVHFEAAEAAKARGDYQTAAVEYLAAYELFQEPEFFFNVAEVHRLAGDEQNALTYYERYLMLDPGGRGAPQARERADQLRRSIAAKQDELLRVEEQRKKHEVARLEALPPVKRDEAPSRDTAAPSRPRGRSLRLAGLAAGGAGAISLGVGVLFGLKAQSLSDELTNANVYDRDGYEERYREGETAERNMFIFTGIGGAAVITGGVLYFLGHRAGAADTAVTLAPSFGPSRVALAVAGRF